MGSGYIVVGVVSSFRASSNVTKGKHRREKKEKTYGREKACVFRHDKYQGRVARMRISDIPPASHLPMHHSEVLAEKLGRYCRPHVSMEDDSKSFHRESVRS